MAYPSLSSYLIESKRRLQANEGLHLVTGNEAGDLDSVASAIGYGYLQTFLSTGSTKKDLKWHIPVTQTSRNDLHLRPENLFAFAVSQIAPDILVCLEDFLPKLDEGKSQVRMTLVDHNKLSVNLARDKQKDLERVVGIVDHHADEGLFTDASPRLIKPCGSCSSLVVSYFKDKWAEAERQVEKGQDVVPRPLAALLMAAIMIDTANLENASKVTDIDVEAMQWLQARSTFAMPSNQRPSLDLVVVQSSVAEQDRSHPASPNAFFQLLKQQKGAIHHLSTDELLRRDYKEFVSGNDYRAGLASVPWNLASWFSRESEGKRDVSSSAPPTTFLKDLCTFCSNRGLHLLGIGTSYKDDTAIKGDKHRRELSVYLPIQDNGKTLADQRPDSASSFARLLENEGHDILKLKLLSQGRYQDRAEWHYYQQENAASTRKQLAPLVKSTLEKYQRSQRL